MGQAMRAAPVVAAILRWRKACRVSKAVSKPVMRIEPFRSSWQRVHSGSSKRRMLRRTPRLGNRWHSPSATDAECRTGKHCTDLVVQKEVFTYKKVVFCSGLLVKEQFIIQSTLEKHRAVGLRTHVESGRTWARTF